MKKLFTFLMALTLISFYGNAQKQLVLNTTGYGFDKNTFNGINPGMWTYIQKWAGLSYNGQDASVTAVRLHVQWQQYEPTPNAYQGPKLAQAIAAILALKPNMKVALHFAYNRHGSAQEQQPGFLADSEIARLADGTKVERPFEITNPSIFSQTAKSRFLNALNNAMSYVAPYAANILYVELGSGDAEEYIMPMLTINGVQRSGFYEDAALQAWRTEYLPCRYPGQSTVTWGGNTYNVATAPSYDPGQWGDWNSDHGREYHRFASWGLFKLYKQFRDVVKTYGSNIKVLGYGPGFGTTSGNISSLHNSIMPISVSELDGYYSTEGEQGSLSWKILVLDVLKGTNINKIAGVEFDPYDLGQQQNPKVIGVQSSIAAEWMARAYKHGADYVHIAMHFENSEIDQLAPSLATIRSTYVNGSYTSPARQAPVTVNIYPTSFTGNFLFHTAWDNQSSSNWATTDVSPKSINMIDDGYWQNIWSCSTPPPCDFAMAATASNVNPPGGASVTLTSSCTGTTCSGLTYSWSGNGISGTGSSVTFNAPASAGTYTYTITASKSGCTNKTATVQIMVGSCIFTPSVSASPSNPSAGASVTLTASCSGSNCTGLTYTWSGNGISGTGTTKTFNAPGTPGTYTYTVTASKSGCTNKTADVSITVPNGGTTFSQCKEAESSTGTGTVTSDPNASNGQTRGLENNYNHYVDYSITSVPSAGTYAVTLRYYSSVAPVVSVTVNGSGAQTVNLANTNSWNITPATQTFNVTLATGTNTIRIQGTGGGSCRQDKICVDGSSCTPPSAPSLSASPATINSGSSSTLSATGCSGGTIAWSNGLGTGTSKSVSPTSSTTYTATCSIGGCTSSNGSVTVTVNTCTPPAAPSLSASPSTINLGSSSTLSATGCSGGTITWSHGLGTGTSKSVSPTSTTTYTATCSVSGCVSGNGSTTVTVNPGAYNQCKESELMAGTGAITSDFNASNGQTRGEESIYNHYVDYVLTGVPSAGTYYVTLRYYSSAAPTVGVQVNGGSTQTVNLVNSNSWNISWTTQQFTVTLAAGNNTIRISGTGGGSCRQDRICVSTSGSPAVLGVDPAEISTGNIQKAMSVSPNPNKGIFETQFYLEKGKKATIIVVDLQGRTIYRQSVTGQGLHKERINLLNKASGTLFLQLHQANSVETKKINIAR